MMHSVSWWRACVLSVLVLGLGTVSSGDEEVTGKLETSSCYFSGRFYKDGDTWQQDKCTLCTCTNGEMSCDILEGCINDKTSAAEGPDQQTVYRSGPPGNQGSEGLPGRQGERVRIYFIRFYLGPNKCLPPNTKQLEYIFLL
ncbi:kielin/chordin-like protein [Octopus bimaculoides]|uniref:kielin/chordin-like protein n=1 Tax=Octopus bimaculoides TaxID=37653 RepID=UPI0022E4DACA|nr:kielin/chordin-like protein [Octopus bimaculoides]